MNEKIFNIISNSFEKNYFLDYGSLQTENALLKQIECFNLNYPTAVKDYFTNLKILFSQALIENFTQFFNLDRCIRFLVQLDEKNRFVCQLSIYGYFSVYHSPYEIKNNLYNYGKKMFIEENEIEICDKLYECSNVIDKKPIWLGRDALRETAFDLSIPKIGHQYLVTVADVLFTQHYI